MITIKFNDKSMTFEGGLSILDVLNQHGYGHDGFAVAVNRCFIPRTKYSITTLKEGDRVEIITPMQGG